MAMVRRGIRAKKGKAMRPVIRVRLLRDLLAANRPTTIVDIGANPFNGKPPYALMRRSGCCKIIGFEPQPEALAALNAVKTENETYLPYAVGTGATETLYLTRNSGLVSTLEPQPWVGEYLNPWWKRAAEVREQVRMSTRRLDDIVEITDIDFLKIDIQGGELNVFTNGRTKLASTALVQTEVAILPYYKGQPTFGDIQAEMTAQGFIAHKFAEVSAHHLGYPLRLGRGLALPPSQATVADVFYLRNPIDMAALESETIRHMALLADAVMRSFDLTLRCLGELHRRNAIGAEALETYVEALRGSGMAAG